MLGKREKQRVTLLGSNLQNRANLDSGGWSRGKCCSDGGCYNHAAPSLWEMEAGETEIQGRAQLH